MRLFYLMFLLFVVRFSFSQEVKIFFGANYQNINELSGEYKPFWGGYVGLAAYEQLGVLGYQFSGIFSVEGMAKKEEASSLYYNLWHEYLVSGLLFPSEKMVFDIGTGLSCSVDDCCGPSALPFYLPIKVGGAYYLKDNFGVDFHATYRVGSYNIIVLQTGLFF